VAVGVLVLVGVGLGVVGVGLGVVGVGLGVVGVGSGVIVLVALGLGDALLLADGDADGDAEDCILPCHGLNVHG